MRPRQRATVEFGGYRPHAAQPVRQRQDGLAGLDGTLLALQRSAGNRAVRTLLVQRSSPDDRSCSCPEQDHNLVPTVQRLTAAEREENLRSARLAGDARLEAAFDNAPPMRVGERGAPVRRVQEELVADGFAMPRSITPTGKLDGVFGAETRETVRQFQIKYAADGLTGAKGRADGVVGRRTLGKLDTLAEGADRPVDPPEELPPCPMPALGEASALLASPLPAVLGRIPIPGLTCNLRLAKPPGAPHACVVGTAIPFNRSGIIRTTTGTVGERFEMYAEWSSLPPASRHPESSYCAAECGEYRQFVRGHALASPNQNGSGLQDVSAKLFGGASLDQNVFQEDGLDRDPKARYGHRDEPVTMSEKYEPDRPTGPRYLASDFPNISIGTFADLHLFFLGETVDTCNGNRTSTHTWEVRFRGIIRP